MLSNDTTIPNIFRHITIHSDIFFFFKKEHSDGLSSNTFSVLPSMFWHNMAPHCETTEYSTRLQNAMFTKQKTYLRVNVHPVAHLNVIALWHWHCHYYTLTWLPVSLQPIISELAFITNILNFFMCTHMARALHASC